MTIISTAMASGNVQDVVRQLAAETKAKLGDQAPALLMAFASTDQPLGALLPALQAEFPSSPLLATSTSGEFVESRHARKSVALFAVAGRYKVFAGLGEGLKQDPEKAVTEALKGVPPSVEGLPHRTGLLLLDPLAGASEEAALLTAALLGEHVPLAGGAAGDDLHMASTHVACGTRVATNAVVTAVIFSEKPLGLGVCHGHQALSGPLKVTRAEGNVVHTIDGRPAWDVWVKETRQAARAIHVDPTTIPDADVGGFLLRYEAGLATGKELKIRAPLARAQDGSLSFACGIPQGAVIRITESLPERQIESAKEAARRARAQLKGHQVAGALVFDCICRNLILGDGFTSAIKGMSQELGGAPLCGFATYGEIAMAAGDLSGFHNTTSVVLAFPS